MNILVVGTNWIGDAVMTIPAVRKLRSMFPDSRVTLLTREWAKDIFAGSGLFEEIVISEGVLADARRLRSSGYELAVVFPNSFRSALTARLSRAKRTFGFATDRRSVLLTNAIEVPDWKGSRHEVFYYLELVAQILKAETVETDDLEPRLAVTEARRKEAWEILSASGARTNVRTVALAAGSTNSDAKRWPAEYFAQLNDRLQSELDVNVILVGSKAERVISQAVADLCAVKPIDLTGRTDLASATALLSSVDLLVSNDMGLAHLAPAVGTRTFVIFGPTNSATTRPHSDNATVVTANVECSPCMLRQCPIDHRCMRRVTPEIVFAEVRKFLVPGF